MRVCLVVLAFVAASCDQPDSSALAAFEEMRPDWKKLPDGSSFARTTLHSKGWDLATRCWPTEVDSVQGFDCVQADTMNELSSTTVKRRFELELPTVILPASSSDGYSCSYLLGYREAISVKADELVTNDLNYSRPWSSRYVKSYMADNSVPGQPYYNCLGILRAIQNGSLATLGTTSVNRSMLD